MLRVNYGNTLRKIRCFVVGNSLSVTKVIPSVPLTVIGQAMSSFGFITDVAVVVNGQSTLPSLLLYFVTSFSSYGFFIDEETDSEAELHFQAPPSTQIKTLTTGY